MGWLSELDFSTIFRFFESKHFSAFLLSTLFAYAAASTASTYMGNYLISHNAKETHSSSGRASATDSSAYTVKSIKVDTILKRNLFDSENTPFPEDLASAQQKKVGEKIGKQNSAIDYSKQAVKTSLPFKLHGTIFTGNPIKGVALLATKGQKSVGAYNVGDKVGKEAKLFQVYREKVVFEHKNQLEFLNIDKKDVKSGARRGRRKGRKSSKSRTPGAVSAPVVSMEGDKEIVRQEGFERVGASSKLTKQFRDRFLNEKLGETLRSAKATPVVENGGIVGWKMSRIKRGSIFKLIGLQEGDIIEVINGTKLTDASKAVTFLNTLREEDHIELKVRRKGKSVDLSVDMK